MAKDPAFLFYPGDYLRDTQTLSEKSQVAYDRIMCEHMRNICITKQQLNFFTKRLTESEIEEIMFVLKEIEGGYCIEWVAESIEKRRQYSNSRKKNREGKNKKDMLTYVEHMEIENEIENVKEIKNKKFIPPTLIEVIEYCHKRNNNVDAAKFIDFYTAKGWMIGKNKMKDWQSAVRTWENDKPKKTNDYEL